MKKILFVAALMMTGAVHAAGGNLAEGPNSVTDTNCTLLNTGASVKITLSTGNVGAYDCNTTSASIGVAVASKTGKNKVFSVGSAGGSITENPLGAAPTSGSDLTTYAEARSASS